MLYKSVLFGNPDLDVNGSTTLQAFKCGFDVMISPINSFSSVSHNHASLTGTMLIIYWQTFTGDWKSLIIKLYGRTILTSSNLIDKWRFHIDEILPTRSQEEISGSMISQAITPTEELVSLFEIAITRHVKMPGYSQLEGIDDGIDEEERLRQASSTTIRAKKLLKFGSSSELMPRGSWSLKVSDENIISQYYHANH